MAALVALGSLPNFQSRPESSVVTRTGVFDGLEPSAMQVTRSAVPAEQLMDASEATGALFVADVVSAEVVVVDRAVLQLFAEPLFVHPGAGIE